MFKGCGLGEANGFWHGLGDELIERGYSKEINHVLCLLSVIADMTIRLSKG